METEKLKKRFPLDFIQSVFNLTEDELEAILQIISSESAYNFLAFSYQNAHNEVYSARNNFFLYKRINSIYKNTYDSLSGPGKMFLIASLMPCINADFLDDYNTLLEIHDNTVELIESHKDAVGKYDFSFLFKEKFMYKEVDEYKSHLIADKLNADNIHNRGFLKEAEDQLKDLKLAPKDVDKVYMFLEGFSKVHSLSSEESMVLYAHLYTSVLEDFISKTDLVLLSEDFEVLSKETSNKKINDEHFDIKTLLSS